MSHRTSALSFAIFATECQRLAKLWGLNEWDIRLRHSNLPDALAVCEPRVVSRIGVIRLSKTWGKDCPTPAALKAAARHEMAHMVTGELISLGRARYVTDDEMTAAIEMTAQRLERLLPK